MVVASRTAEITEGKGFEWLDGEGFSEVELVFVLNEN